MTFKGIQAATAAVQGLAAGDIKAAIAGGAAPYLAEVIHKMTTDENGNVNKPANLMAHAVVNAALAAAQGNNVLVGAGGAATAEMVGMIATSAYGKPVSELSETEKQTVSALASLAAGLTGGLIGDSGAATVAAAQAGKTTVENNFLSSTSSEKRDKLADKVLNGDKSLQTSKEFLQLENADARSDALVTKFNKEPGSMSGAERAELASYLRVYAAEMQAQHGEDVTRELIIGMLSGQNYQQSAPQTKAQQEAQKIMNTWGYHKSNASIGDLPLTLSGSVLGSTIKEAIAINVAIGTAANTVSQLAGKDPFSYVDLIMAGMTSAATTGKGIGASAAINMGGAAIGSGIKGENPVNSVIGAGIGSLAGSKADKYITGGLSTAGKAGTAGVIGAVGGSAASEIVSGMTKDTLDSVGKKDAEK